jgi:hypothetical protein
VNRPARSPRHRFVRTTSPLRGEVVLFELLRDERGARPRGTRRYIDGVRVLLAWTIAAALAAADAPVLAEPTTPVDQPKPINTVCPIQGDPVDRQVDVVVIELLREDKIVRVPVGVCCEDCLHDLRRDPQRYAAAALENIKAPKPKK